MKRILYSALAILILASCNKNEDMVVSGNGNYPTDGVVRISTTVNDLKTRAGAAPYTGATLSLSLDYGVGDKYTQSNIEWTSVDNGTTWAPSTLMLWKDATTATKVYAFAPFVACDDLTAVPFTVQQDQSSGVESSDLLGYMNNSFIPGSSLATKNELNIDLSHKLSKLTLNITFGNQFGTAPTIGSLLANSVEPAVAYNATTGVASTTTGNAITIKTHSLSATSYDVIFPAQTIPAGTKMLTVVLANGDAYNYTVPASGHTFVNGAAYTMTLKVGKDKLELESVTVEAWSDGEAISGGEAINKSDDWDGTFATKFTAGAGTKDNPYLIRTAEELALLSTYVCNQISPINYSKSHYKLMTDVDLKYQDWTPIGSGLFQGQVFSQGTFTGSFDGNGHIISGLKVTAITTNENKIAYVGLFGMISPGYDDQTIPSIQNLVILDAKIYAGSTVTGDANGFQGAGILAGHVSSMQIPGGSHTAKIKNCRVSGTIHHVAGTTAQYVGGLVGYAQGAEIANCRTDVTIDTEASSVGGLLGYVFGTEVKNSHCDGSIKGTWYMGGFVGGAEPGTSSYMTITDCTTSVDVTSSNWNVGGFIGYSKATVIQCSASGDVVSTVNWGSDYYHTGGFVGTNAGLKQKCTYSGTLTYAYTAEDSWKYYGAFTGNHAGGTTEGCRFDGTKNPLLDKSGLSWMNKIPNVGFNDISNTLK